MTGAASAAAARVKWRRLTARDIVTSDQLIEGGLAGAYFKGMTGQ
jgi:hypothetical protein